MPVSPVKEPLLPNRPDTKALNKLLENLSSEMRKSPKKSPNKPVKSKNSSSPTTAKKFQNSSSQPTLRVWLSKSTLESLQTTRKPTEEPKKDRKTKAVSQSSPKPLKIAATKLEKDKSSFDSKDPAKLRRASRKLPKPTLKRFNSGSSDELPTFKEKTSRKRQKQTETFKKYGVIIPSLEEIVADQKKFTSYKTQVEEAQTLKEPTFKMPVTPEKLNLSEERESLDCKQLTLTEITEHFNNNIPFLRDIINGKKYSDRHRRYHAKKNKLDELTTNDLTYSISTIVFTFEQLDHMISLMQSEFDPEDKKTGYFFKVLVPELCLKIFMENHNMNKREANAYLENRPVE